MSVKKIKLAILISGRGSNMEALIASCLYTQDYPAEVSCVISNNTNASGLKIAEGYKIPTFCISNQPLDINKLNSLLIYHSIDLVCLAGFMRIINDIDFLAAWKGKIINIHPSLLPAFKGLNPQQKALDLGVKITGCTVHYVVPEIDAGPIIFQAAVSVLPHDNVKTLSDRILKKEHVIYSHVVKLLALNKILLTEDNTITSDEDLSYL